MRLNLRVQVRLAVGIACAGCADARVVLGSNAGDAGSPAPASCQASGPGRTDCGAASESCCTSLEVPGGTFYRSYESTAQGPENEADPATLSTFRLDKYLVTVGRFRQFVRAWDGGAGWVPPAGSGVHTFLNAGRGLNATGGGYEPGWVASDDAQVAPTDTNLDCTSSLEPNQATGSRYGTWTPSSGNQENLPITCANWYEAYAFCIWDGGFLPSEAELEYAAVGGPAQREFPWGSTAPGNANQYAIYDCYYPNGAGACTGVASIAPVGSAPLGAGLWGHDDLAGSVWEWTLDWEAAYVSPCVDCADFTAAVGRAAQGGNFDTPTGNFPPSRHSNAPGDSGAYAYGFRCARSP